MSVQKHFIPFSAPERDRLTSVREGETKLGQALPCPVLSGSSISPLDLAAIASQGVRYVVIGIPEDIGVRANGGRPGASEGWSAFLSAFLNLQANQFIDPTTVMILGTVETADLMQRASAFAGSGPDDVRQLRSLCAEIDSRVAPLVRMIVEASLEPIVIGGGHNNSYPLIRGCV
jgi:formiminoglutamase